MTRRERWVECLTFGRPDHFIFEHSFGLMPGTLERWHSEGLPQHVDEQGIYDYFGFEPRIPALPVNFDPYPGFDVTETETEGGVVLRRDAMGVGRRLTAGLTTLAIPFEFPVQGPEDWEEYKRRLQFSPQRIGTDLEERYGELRRRGLPVRLGWKGFYWFPRDLMGDEALCMAYYTQPDLVKDILKTYSEMILAVSEEVVARVDIDWVHMGEDMCYRNAMMISPRLFREFMTPHYRCIWDLYSTHGARIFSVDTDGYLGQLIPLLMEAGVNAVTPCEVQAGNDLVAMRREHGRQMAFMRGINKLALADRPRSLVPGSEPGLLTPKQAIAEELEYRLPPLLKTGGYVAGLDHRVVPETSLQSFIHYVRRAREMLGLSPDIPALERA